MKINVEKVVKVVKSPSYPRVSSINSPHPPGSLLPGEGSNNKDVNDIAHLPRERGWGEVDFKRRIWKEVDDSDTVLSY